MSGKLSGLMTGVRNDSCSGASPIVIWFLFLSSMKFFNSSSETPINCMFLNMGFIDFVHSQLFLFFNAYDIIRIATPTQSIFISINT